jgi:HAAS
MSAEDPIAIYIRELKAHLRARGPRRRRIVSEVRTHLCERRSDIQRDGVSEPRAAAQEAIARFGDAERMAAQFNRVPRTLRPFERRLATLWLAWIAAMAMGTATVWAAVDSGGTGTRYSARHAGGVTPIGRFCAPAGSHLRLEMGKTAGAQPILQSGGRPGRRGESPRCP